VDADQALSEFMDANEPRRGRFLELFGAKIREAENAAVVRRVVVFGEMVAVLWAQKKIRCRYSARRAVERACSDSFVLSMLCVSCERVS
jgi:hypothetical protein